ncbi:MAG: hypothetical protein WBA16_00550 [Nonlabens sp.]
MQIPIWFWKLMIIMCAVCVAIIGYRIYTGEQNRSFIWFAFLFLMAIWYALRQLRAGDKDNT